MADIQHPLNMKVVLDSGNGMAVLIAPELFKRLGCEVIDLFSEPDGTFPNHAPDPTVLKNMGSLVKEVARQDGCKSHAFRRCSRMLSENPSVRAALDDDYLILIHAREG